jgi:hypothetical protein
MAKAVLLQTVAQAAYPILSVERRSILALGMVAAGFVSPQARQ